MKMKLTKINYVSAVFFGAIALVMYLALGVLQWSLRDVFIAQGIPVTWVQTFITTPVVGAVVGFLVVLIMIVIYNQVARKFPIGWTVSK